MFYIQKKNITLIIFFLMALFFNTVNAMTIQEEIELGKVFVRQVKSQLPIIEDQDILAYVSYVGNRLLENVPEKYFDFHFYVIREQTYNAFAGPGGHIFIHSGLIESMTSELELAGILAHEIAHVTCRHISERIDRSKKMNMATLAGTIAGILIGGNVGVAMVYGSAAAQQSMFLAYTREDEREADQNSLRYLRDARYNGRGLISILKKIRKVSWADVSDIPTYMMTHPGLNERLSYIDTALSANPDFARLPEEITLSRFKKINIRLRALYGDSHQSKLFALHLINNPNDYLSRYGYGLRLAVSGKREAAISELKKALQSRPFDADILRDTGITYFYDGHYKNAIKYLQSANDIVPNDVECQFFMGRTREKLGNSDAAAQLWERLLTIHPDHNKLHYYLGNLYGKKGSTGDAHYHLGIFYEKKNNVRLARFHLKKALGATDKSSSRYAEIEKLLKNIKSPEKKMSPNRVPGIQSVLVTLLGI
ncbi:peptidase M48 Ste24p [Candidatus Magnetomorum sp. HK-1]|nr:peptidase M48 Ste24p [Candidatus Magnetomorum sp. HK-1]